MEISSALLHHSSQTWLLDGKFGLEKEHVRVDLSGQLARTPHPASFADKLANPFITVDFSESQLEMITPPLNSIHEALGFLETIHDVVNENLNEEVLWPQSMPPELPENGNLIPLAQFDSEHHALNEYRRFLAQTYGRKKQMISGVHFNFSLSPRLIDNLRSLSSDPLATSNAFIEALYMRALRNMMRHRWVIIALIGNSPAIHSSYASICPDVPDITPRSCCSNNSVSLRASVCGYRNNEEFILNYQNWESLHRSIRELVDSGKLIHEKELYNPIRLKTDLNSGEITHLEVRLIDLDPTTKVAVRPSTLHLLHLFFLWSLAQEESQEFDESEQKIANANQYNCACCGLESQLLSCDGTPITEPATLIASFISELRTFISGAHPHACDYQQSLDQLTEQLRSPELSPREQTRRGIATEGFVPYHLRQALHFKSDKRQSTFRFHAYEHLELSTQLIMRESIRRGIKIDLIDPSENFLKLSQGKHIEYVQQATKTSLDPYSVILMMENKLVTKKILQAASISVPSGGHYTHPQSALADLALYLNNPIVVKPKSTNFGLGITILKDNTTPEHFNQAVDIAFSHDSSILIEPFIAGREFRFFLINGVVEAILLRVPANVIGNGTDSIRELVEMKNVDPLRGRGYRTPLEKINLGDAEKLFLETQSLHFDSIPADKETIYLRENSNISTGGDSIDYTEEIHPSYLAVASKAAAALGVAITGLDMMIPDIKQPATADNYAIIEMNFNPAIHIHCFPHRGKNRRLNSKILDALGFT